ncbi:tetratricopeptide repeat protein [Lunatibacter salilacus]|uniref:tetratricopeptide repeat protein n=1 Tax=Lunatibacter salilacus TaxID=2483804 RepID=UPI00131CC773|nr:hypothetical protein [Lunatibacter salilacus]
MIDTIEYIEKYFRGNLSDEEKAQFERKCEVDPAFAEEVGLYISVRDNIRKGLHAEKKRQFDGMYKERSSKNKGATDLVKSRPFLKNIRTYITLTAACLLLLLGWMVFFTESSPKQLASTYIENNLQMLSVPMDASQDSLQLGIGAFNQQDYVSAEKIFRSLANQDKLAPEAIKNLGILYLVTDEYDKAIREFEVLSEFTNLRANPGAFYKAVTLMKRDESGDAEKAKEILEDVINKNLPGSKEAAKWINEL